jgi:replication factor C subunit 3/5
MEQLESESSANTLHATHATHATHITHSSPWVEKYRPTRFEDIVLDKWNRKILTNMIHTKNFKNILFYGPPGTGKTTTIINLIKEYQILHNEHGKDLIIHLNASDERGIDVIRNQIYGFVNTKNLFGNGTKFVILDEVDYMTKKAQQALIKLIDENKSIRFCLICNYISRIEKSLQDSFMNFRFNQLPVDNIIVFLSSIAKRENLNISQQTIANIQSYFNSDIRSMINYLQSNNSNHINMKLLIDNNTFDVLLKQICSAKQDPDASIESSMESSTESSTSSMSYYDFIIEIHNLAHKYNIDRRELLKKFCYYIYYDKHINILSIMKNILHDVIDIDILFGYLFTTLRETVHNV